MLLNKKTFLIFSSLFFISVSFNLSGQEGRQANGRTRTGQQERRRYLNARRQQLKNIYKDDLMKNKR